MSNYKTTFNYLLTHKVIPHMYFSGLDFFYETIIPNPENMQIFMQNAIRNAMNIAEENPDIEPGYMIETFQIDLCREKDDRAVIIVEIPGEKRPPDSVHIAFPFIREKAGYFTCEYSIDPLSNETLYILGEWKPKGEGYSHSNYGKTHLEKQFFGFQAIEISYGKSEENNENLNNEDIDANENASNLARSGCILHNNGKYKEALDYFNQVMKIEDSRALFFHIRAQTYMAMGNNLAADYDMFRAKLIDMNDAAKDQEIDYKVEDALGLGRRMPLITNESSFDILGNDKGSLVFCIKNREGEVRLPEIFYAGGNNALFRRRMDQYILLDNISPEAKDALEKTAKDGGEVLVADVEKGVADSGSKIESVREYTVPVRYLSVIDCFDSIDDIREDGYPLFVSLASLVRANKDRAIKDVILFDDYSNLAAILAREEDYSLLDKYIAEGLPLNESLGWWFKDWQPTPIFYITGKNTWPCLKEPIKMMQYLVKNGADPNIACVEGDTPLGNQCLAFGTVEIMKTLINCGADPNIDTVAEGNVCKPLVLALMPAGYDEENGVLQPRTDNDFGKISLMISAGADVEAALGEILTFAENGYSAYYYILYEFYAGFPDSELEISEISQWKNMETAERYLKLSAGGGFIPAIDKLGLG